MRAAIACLLVLLTSLGQVSEAKVGQRTVKIVFINGILNTQSEAQASLDQLSSLLEHSKLRSSKEFEQIILVPSLAYNQEGIITDWLYEIELNKAIELQYIDQLQASMLEGQDYHLALNYQELGNLYSQWHCFETPGIKTAISNGITQVTQGLDAGNDVIIVAHSQGNIIANYVYMNLMGDEKYRARALSKVRVINVANVSLFSPSNVDITLDSDHALATLHSLEYKTLPASIRFDTAGYPCTILCHEFLDVYLSDKIRGFPIAAGRYVSTVRRQEQFLAPVPMKNMIVNAFFTLVENIAGVLPKHFNNTDLKDKGFRWANSEVVKTGKGSYVLSGSTGGELVGATEYDQGAKLTFTACLPITRVSYAAVGLNQFRYDDLDGNYDAQYFTVPEVQALTRYEAPGYVQLHDGSGGYVECAANSTDGNKICGDFVVEVNSAGYGHLRFKNSNPAKGEKVCETTSADKLPFAIRRMESHQYQYETITLDNLVEYNQPFIQAGNPARQEIPGISYWRSPANLTGQACEP